MGRLYLGGVDGRQERIRKVACDMRVALEGFDAESRERLHMALHRADRKRDWRTNDDFCTHNVHFSSFVTTSDGFQTQSVRFSSFVQWLAQPPRRCAAGVGAAATASPLQCPGRGASGSRADARPARNRRRPVRRHRLRRRREQAQPARGARDVSADRRLRRATRPAHRDPLPEERPLTTASSSTLDERRVRVKDPRPRRE
jgi:hypothetical protein